MSCERKCHNVDEEPRPFDLGLAEPLSPDAGMPKPWHHMEVNTQPDLDVLTRIPWH